MPLLMVLTVVAIGAFQFYWLQKAYGREARTLEMRTNTAFRETVFTQQGFKLKLDKILGDSLQNILPEGFSPGGRPHGHLPNATRNMERLVNVLYRRINDSDAKQKVLITTSPGNDTLIRTKPGRRMQAIRLLYELESPNDTLTANELTAALAQRLKAQNIKVPFAVQRVPVTEDEERDFSKVIVGLKYPAAYQLQLGNTMPYLLRRIAVPILMSLFLVLFTALSFWVLYRNLLRQRRLADIKNEFISNITHELKTPIATVSVAIEALRSFNADTEPQKRKEYLDISASELQRLSLLVDKVLKLSMFEKKEIDLKYEALNLTQLVQEVVGSMQLQAQKFGATITVQPEGNTELYGDRLHLVSVIYNLLDNALKYSKGTPQINIVLKGTAETVHLVVQDNGIGIPAEYSTKVFEKFFRVPTGNVHNTKGYGLGLSYLAHVVEKHKGTVQVQPAGGGGSVFTVTLPKRAA